MPTAIPFDDVSPDDVASLWNEAYQGAKMTGEEVSNKLDEHFEPQGSFAAIEGMEIVGCVLSQVFPEIESDAYWFIESPGVILAVLVAPTHRRQGVP